MHSQPSCDPYPITPIDWWTDPARACPEGSTIEGAPPPLGRRIWCARNDGVRHGPFTEWTQEGRHDQHYSDGTKSGWDLQWTVEGRLLAARYYEADLLHGPALASHGHWVEEGCYAAGKRHGRWSARRSADGSRIWLAEYRGGERHGDWQRWHGNGQLAEAGRFEGNLREGRWTWWYENGTRSRETEYSLGVPEGLHRVWTREGQVLDEAQIENGTGRWFEYYDDGSKRLEGHYRNRRRDGLWSQWDPAGQLIGTYTFHAGDGVEIEWDRSGRERRETEYRDDRKHGTETSWNQDGDIESVEYYVDDTLVRSSDYDAGELTQVTEWDDGEIVRSLHYDRGVLSTTWDRLPGGERVISFQEGEAQEVTITSGLLSHQTTRNTLLTDPEPGSAYGDVELHNFGNMSIRIEHAHGRVARMIFQSGDSEGPFRRMHLIPRRPAQGEQTMTPSEPPQAFAGAASGDAWERMLQGEFDLVEIDQRQNDGLAIKLELDGGKIARVVESRDGKVIRDATLATPQFVDLSHLQGLIDSLRERGIEFSPDDDEDDVG